MMGDSGRDTMRSIPIINEKIPNIAPVVLYPKKLKNTDDTDTVIDINNKNTTNNANVAIIS